MEKGQLLEALKTNPTFVRGAPTVAPNGIPRKRYLQILANHAYAEDTLPEGVRGPLSVFLADNRHLHADLRRDGLIERLLGAWRVSREGRRLFRENAIKPDLTESYVRALHARFASEPDVTLDDIEVIILPPALVIEPPRDPSLPRFTKEEALAWTARWQANSPGFALRMSGLRFVTYATVIANHRHAQSMADDLWLTAQLSAAVFEETYPTTPAPTAKRSLFKFALLIEERAIKDEDGHRWKTTSLADDLSIASEIQASIGNDRMAELVRLYGKPRHRRERNWRRPPRRESA